MIDEGVPNQLFVSIYEPLIVYTTAILIPAIFEHINDQVGFKGQPNFDMCSCSLVN